MQAISLSAPWASNERNQLCMVAPQRSYVIDQMFFKLPGCKSALGLGGGPVRKKECSGKIVPLSFALRAPEPFQITACATAVTVCIFDIRSDTKKEQVWRITATILFSSLCTEKSGDKANYGQQSCHCSIWQCNVLRELYCKLIPAEG